jgi:hypothetical protein
MGKGKKKIKECKRLRYAEWQAFEELQKNNPIVKRYMSQIELCKPEDKEGYYQRMIMELIMLIDIMFQNLSNINDEAEASLEDYFGIMGDSK